MYFFANVGSNLAKTIPSITRNFKDFLPTSNVDSTVLRPTDENEVCKATFSLKNSYSKGHNEISSVMLKHCINKVCQPLTVIFNKSFEDGIVPTGVEIAKVIPVFKADDKKDCLKLSAHINTSSSIQSHREVGIQSTH